MDKQNRKAIIAGNWKMNKTATEAKALISELIPAVKDAGCEVVICVPFTDLVTAVEMTKGTNIHVGAENVHFEKSGAFTGEISADMLTAALSMSLSATASAASTLPRPTRLSTSAPRLLWPAA